MIGYIFAVFGWNIYWIIYDIINKRNYFEKYNVNTYGWVSILLWLFNLSGVGALILYCT